VLRLVVALIVLVLESIFV
jgi:hypothetical protein